jgi:hypothetical protein
MTHKVITAIVDTYVDKKTGEKKNVYKELGTVFESKNGPMLRMTLIPINWNGYAYLNEPYDKSKDKSNEDNSSRSDFRDDDIPF